MDPSGSAARSSPSGATARSRSATPQGQAPADLPRGKGTTVWKALLNASVDVNVGDLGTENGQAAEWISAYLFHAAIETDRADATPDRRPYWDGEDICIFATTLLAHLRDVRHERIDDKQLALMMRGAGARHERVNIRSDGRGTTTTVYRLAPSLHGQDPADR